MNRLSVLMSVFSVILFNLSLSHAQSSGYKVSQKVAIAGDGKWDFLTFDHESRRLYISHGSKMQVLNVDTKEIVGEVENTPGIHGIAIVPELNKGYTSNGKDTTVTVFDLTSFKTIQRIKLKGQSPDHIIYDTFSKKIFVFNNKSKDVSIIDPAKDVVIHTIDLKGKPELAVSDENGRVYVNLEDKNEIVVIDSKTFEVKSKWSLAPGAEPTGLAFDKKNKRLFAGCSNKLLVVVDVETGKVMTTLPIGEGVDGVAFSPLEKLIFSSNGDDGTLTIIKQNTADQYSVVENVLTHKGAKTLAFDEKKNTVYLSSAEYNAPSDGNLKPTIIANSFGILFVSK
ncbi:MAG: YncE family protein [Chitinophagaceae bacterium]|nr:YncE family protein [Chitinophagaceae bacterium]